jgi:hypothetical protein
MPTCQGFLSAVYDFHEVHLVPLAGLGYGWRSPIAVEKNRHRVQRDFSKDCSSYGRVYVPASTPTNAPAMTSTCQSVFKVASGQEGGKEGYRMALSHTDAVIMLSLLFFTKEFSKNIKEQEGATSSNVRSKW